MFALALPACGNREAAAPSGKNVCEALAIAAEVGKKMLDHATQQYVSADHAIEKWDRWREMAAKPMHDSGELSDAGNRANMYRATGDAVCKMAALNYWQMHELLRITSVFPDLLKQQELWLLARFDGQCGSFESTPVSNEASKRKEFFDRWRADRVKVEEAAMAAVSECYTKFGGTRPVVIVPGTRLRGE